VFIKSELTKNECEVSLMINYSQHLCTRRSASGQLQSRAVHSSESWVVARRCNVSVVV